MPRILKDYNLSSNGPVEIPELLAPFPTEFTFDMDGTCYRITRRDNHGYLTGAWMVVCFKEFYLVTYPEPGWVYKQYTSFRSPALALQALLQTPYSDSTRRNHSEPL